MQEDFYSPFQINSYMDARDASNIETLSHLSTLDFSDYLHEVILVYTPP
jgi:hypothetical protein